LKAGRRVVGKKVAELFTNFEINATPRWRRLLRLTGLSLVFHGAVVASLVFVPALRDALNIARLVSGAEYVDEDYDRTIIGDRAELIDLSADGKLHYPPGYFKRPEAPTPAPVIVEPKPTPTPKPKPTPTPTPAPSPSPSATPADVDKAGETAATGDAQTKEDAEKSLDEAAKKTGLVRPEEGKINKRPLKDWLAYADELKRNAKLDLTGTVKLIIVAQRDAKGKLHNPRPTVQSGDPNLIAVAKRLVGAINDSNVLYFLEGSGEGQVRFIIVMDQSQVTASVESEVESADQAQKMASGYGVMLLLGKTARQGKDEAVIYQNTRISARGNQVVVNFSMPRHAAGEMLKKQLPST
jgi:hypothetical protein